MLMAELKRPAGKPGEEAGGDEDVVAGFVVKMGNCGAAEATPQAWIIPQR
jgi:hypothetical protein